MAFIISNRVKETSTSTGTGNITVAGAVTKFRAFSTVCATSDTFIYAIEHDTANEWEIGYGTYSSANTITRTTLIDSSTGSAVSFTAGTKYVYITTADFLSKGNFVGGIFEVKTGISAAGTNQGTATAITGSINFVSTVASGTGVILPAAIPSATITVINHGLNTLLVYPATGETVEGLAANTGMPLLVGQCYRATCGTAGAWDGIDLNIYDDENQCLSLPLKTGGVATTDDSVKLYARNLAGMPVLQTDNNFVPVPSAIQSSFATNNCKKHQSLGSNNLPGIGISANATVMTTATARTGAATSIVNATRRTGSVSAATAGAVCGMYYSSGDANLLIPSTTYNSTLFSAIRFNVADAAAVTGARMFVGMQTGSTAPTNVEPNTLTNCYGFAQLSTDNTQFYFVYGGSTAQTAIALGTSVGAPTSTTTLYDAYFHARLVGANVVIGYTLLNKNTGVEVSGSVSGSTATVLPVGLATGALRAWRSNNATALAVAIDVAHFYSEGNL